MADVVRVLVEVGRKRVFASALDWPGWARSGRSEELALEALAAYAPRYAPVCGIAGLALPPSWDLAVEQRLPGTATTDFGAPDVVADEETDPMPAERATRAALLLDAAWSTFDSVVADSPEGLVKGPRGGGRDRTALVEHVLGAQAAYARMISAPVGAAAAGDPAAIEAMRRTIADQVRTGVAGQRPRGGQPWPIAYAARRLAWHVLDHAWEMEDRRP